MPTRTRRRSIAGTFLWIFFAVVAAPPAQGDLWGSDERGFLEWAAPIAGAYSLPGDEHLIVTPHPRFPVLSLFWLERGDVRALERTEDGRFAFGSGLYANPPFAGHVDYVPRQDGVGEMLRLRREGQSEIRAPRLPMEVEEITIRVGQEARLAGVVVAPPGDGPFPAAVMIPSGFNDRYEHWRIAMTLLTRGVASVLYDARLAGESSGEPLPGHYYTRSQVRVRDAAAVVSFARQHPRLDPDRVGVFGWSQGGWLGAIVAGSDSGVAFYVNIAGNLNPGWQQARHARLNDLRYEGFSESAVEEARAYFDAFFGLMRGEIPWPEYESHRKRIAATPWFRWLEERGLSVAWESPDEARRYVDKEKDNVPERDLTRVRQPALGIYFQFDESSPPDSPEIFVRGLRRAGNADLTLRVIPLTSHEGWVVEDYQREADEPPTRLAPEIFQMVADWIAERTLP